MPKFGCDDGNMVKTFAIGSPPISPPVRRRWPALAKNDRPGSTMTQRHPNNLTVELGQTSLDRLERLEAVLDGIAAGLSQVQEQQGAMTTTLTDLRDFVVTERTFKDWYSPVEVAEILGKKPYTVREWCRLQRVEARKRPTGRGDADEWEISHDELDRIKNHGLLPIPTKY